MDIKVSIIEDQKDIREMLAVLINGSNGFCCINTYDCAEDAIIGIPNSVPDVVLVDIHLPGKSGIECVLKLKPILPAVHFVMCTSLEDNDNIFNALKAGAIGYITKSIAPAKLLESIIEVYNGGSPMTSNIARKVVGSFQQTESKISSSIKVLSNREQEILNLLSKGFRYKEIAEKLFVSIETVRTHVRNIYEKLQVNSRTEAINKAFSK